MNDEKLVKVLPGIFWQTKLPLRAKEDLRRRLFGAKELSDDALLFVAAAGELAEPGPKNGGKEDGYDKK